MAEGRGPRGIRPRHPALSPGTRPKAAAFSLVEVVLAVGVIGFSILAILGLLTVGYNSANDSAAKTESGLLAQQIVGQLRTKPFKGEQAADKGENIFPLPALDAAGNSTTFLIDKNGRYLGSAADSGGNAEAVKAVEVTVADSVQLAGDDTPKLTDDNWIARVEMRMSWPPQAPADQRQSVSYYTEVSNLAQ